MTIAGMIDIERAGWESTKHNVEERVRALTHMLAQVAHPSKEELPRQTVLVVGVSREEK